MLVRKIPLTFVSIINKYMPKRIHTENLRSSLLKAMFYEGELSLAELSVRCHKSIPNVTNAILGLLKEGYVLEHKLAASSGGRRPTKFSLNQEKNLVFLAVAMDQLVTRIAFFGLGKNIIGPVQTQNINVYEEEGALKKFVSFVSNVIADSGFDRDRILGIGIAMPGFINVEEGINYSFFTQAEGSLSNYLTKELSLPVYIDNDSSAIALAELRFGAAYGLKNVMVVNISWGIGLGMIVNGSLFRGHSGYAGEFSHIPLSKTDDLCACGKRGCLEVDSSLVVIARRAEEAVEKGAKSSLEKLFEDDSKLPGEHLLHAAAKGDPLAVSLLSESAFMIGKGLATLIHIMNPERIVLSGRGAEAGNIILFPVHQALNEFCIPKLLENTEIVISNLGYEAELMGAATIAVENCEF